MQHEGNRWKIDFQRKKPVETQKNLSILRLHFSKGTEKKLKKTFLDSVRFRIFPDFFPRLTTFSYPPEVKTDLRFFFPWQVILTEIFIPPIKKLTIKQKTKTAKPVQEPWFFHAAQPESPPDNLKPQAHFFPRLPIFFMFPCRKTYVSHGRNLRFTAGKRTAPPPET